MTRALLAIPAAVTIGLLGGLALACLEADRAYRRQLRSIRAGRCSVWTTGPRRDEP